MPNAIVDDYDKWLKYMVDNPSKWNWSPKAEKHYRLRDKCAEDGDDKGWRRNDMIYTQEMRKINPLPQINSTPERTKGEVTK